QQACGTGLEAALLLSNKIALGQIESGIAGGADTASDAPIMVSEKLRKKLLAANRAKGTKNQLTALAKIRITDLGILTPANVEPRTGLSMGAHMAITAKKWGITREAPAVLTVRSHQRTAAACGPGCNADPTTTCMGQTRDQNQRPDSSRQKLAQLRPVLGTGPDATLTAGNSTPLSDGASADLL